MDRSQDRKSLYMTVLMTPDMANFSGNVHGGTPLKLLDQVACSCASRNHTGRTSMEVGIRVETENIQNGTRRHTKQVLLHNGRGRPSRPAGAGARTGSHW